jgi:methionyl-tRNA formyltransferase
MRVVFLGTPEFAVPTLQALAIGRNEIIAVFTQPDRPKGRGGQLTASPVKQEAVRLGLPVHQPERIRRPENVLLLAGMKPDAMVVVGFGQIIPQAIIDIPPLGILNVHASLLPKYRGAAPIQWAIAHGEQETGITIMRIDAGLDTGDMILKWSTPIGPDETAPQLAARLSQRGSALLVEALRQIERGTASFEKQDDSQATIAPILKKEDGAVVWSRPAAETYNRLRGFTPWPGAFTTLRGQTLQITRAAVAPRPVYGPPGTSFVERPRWIVSCGGQTALELHEVQLEGKKRLPVDVFLNGYPIRSGEKLGGAD